MSTTTDAFVEAATISTHLPPDLPVLPEDITAKWLSKVLERKVKSVALDRKIPGTATKVFITVTYEDGSSPNKLPTQLCVKGGFDPKFMKTMPWIIMLYQRECDFYNLVAPKLDNMELPRSWWAGHNATQGILIMDDLAAQGCSFGDPAETWPVTRVLAGVEQLAALHARTWHLQASDIPWLTSDYDHAILTLMKTYDAVVRSPDRPPIPSYLKDQPRITAALQKHFTHRNPKYHCLLHGDPHIGNTYLLPNANTPHFLDFQTLHLGSPFHDLSYFLGSALSIPDRRTHEWSLVAHYLHMLEEFGVSSSWPSRPSTPLSISDDEVAKEYKKSFLAGIGWIMCPYEMQAKESVYPMAMRFAAALDDHGVVELVEGLE